MESAVNDELDHFGDSAEMAVKRSERDEDRKTSVEEVA